MSHITNHLIGLLEVDGGFTYNPVTGSSPTEGYVVAITPPTGKDWRSFEPGTVTEADIAQFVFDFFGLLSTRGNRGRTYMVGGWRAEDRDALDVVTVYADRSEALLAAETAGQDAIFDLKEGEEVWVT